MQDAVETALKRWPIDGIPDHPDAWLLTTARRRGIDLLRRQANYREKLARLQWPVPSEPDDRLKLVFTCCHPALPVPAQVALTLRTVCGLTTGQIAAAFLVPESTVAQRITRAKRKITDARIPYRIPPDTELHERLNQVLAVVYLLFNEGYLTSGGDRPHARDLADDAQWLAESLAWLMPRQSRRWACSRSSGCTRRAPPPASTPTGISSCCATRTAPGGTTPRSRTPSG